MAPRIHTLISLLEFPPKTGLLCTRIVWIPALAADRAAHTPETPPPITVSEEFIATVFIIYLLPFTRTN